LQTLDADEFLRDLAGAVLQKLMEHELGNINGAALYDRSDQRATQRNGFRERTLGHQLGAFDLKIP